MNELECNVSREDTVSQASSDVSPQIVTDEVALRNPTLKESLFAFYLLAERIANALEALASIPEEISYLAMAIEARPDYSDLLRELIEVVRENNRLLKANRAVEEVKANV